MYTSCPTVDAVLLQKTESTITSETLTFPGYIQVLKNVLSPYECQELINATEAHGFKRASLYTDIFGKEYFSDTRKSERCIVDSPQFVAALEERLRPYLPAEFRSGKLKGINERLRFLKYTAGDEFKPHVDGSYTADDGAISRITILIYLNADYTGAYTEFAGESDWMSVVPESGMIVLQDQSLLHRVPPLLTGCKYVIRTEVMYYPPAPNKSEFKDITVTM
jgi:hypothetical protein